MLPPWDLGLVLELLANTEYIIKNRSLNLLFCKLITDFDAFFSESEWAFDLLYCVAFIVMDKKWEQKNASYMEFNVS